MDPFHVQLWNALPDDFVSASSEGKKGKNKGMALIHRHEPHTTAIAELSDTHRAGAQPRQQPKTAIMDFGLQPYSYT